MRIVEYLFGIYLRRRRHQRYAKFFGSSQVGSKAYAVYKANNDAEFAQNDLLLQTNRIHAFGPARYGSDSNTSIWLRLHTRKICERIVADRELNFAKRISDPRNT